MSSTSAGARTIPAASLGNPTQRSIVQLARLALELTGSPSSIDFRPLKAHPGAPDLAVEVVCPGSEERDLGIKKDACEQAGVKEYWVVWQPFPRVEVYRLKKSGRYGKPLLFDGREALRTQLLPGFSLQVCRLYAGQAASGERA